MNKERVSYLLSKKHIAGVPSWTSAETQEAMATLKELAYLWFRAEEFATIIAKDNP